MIQKKFQVQIFFWSKQKKLGQNILLVQKYLQIQKHVGSRIIEVQEKFWFEEKIWSKKMWVEKICYNNVLAKKTYWFTFLSFNSLFTEKFTIHVFTPWVLLCNCQVKDNETMSRWLGLVCTQLCQTGNGIAALWQTTSCSPFW